MTSRRAVITTGLGALAAVSLDARLLTGLLPPADSDLDIARRAERWISTSRRDTDAGITWPADPLRRDSVQLDLYNGMPGVVLFYSEMYHATRERRFLDEARAGGDELIAQLPSITNAGLYTGLAGAAWVLEEVHRASGDGRFRDGANRALSLIHDRAEKVGTGVAWDGENSATDIISGNAGIGLFLLWADREMRHAPSRSLAIASGRRLVELGQPAGEGVKWNVAPSVKNLYPNFSHGTAGVGYFLASLYETTRDRAFLDAAQAGATYLSSVADVSGGGFRVFHHEPGGKQLYYLSWCHGPAGTSRFYHKLSQVTGETRWSDMVRRGARATIDSGIPEQRTPGFWNNISQCCGNCGVGEYFLWMQRTSPSREHGQMVQRAADDTLRRSTVEEGGLKWIQAENRVSPDQVVAQTGWMQGAAGVGAFFLHKHAQAAGKAPAIVWPDAPR